MNPHGNNAHRPHPTAMQNHFDPNEMVYIGGPTPPSPPINMSQRYRSGGHMLMMQPSPPLPPPLGGHRVRSNSRGGSRGPPGSNNRGGSKIEPRSNSRGRSRSQPRSNSRGRSRSQPRRNNRGGSRNEPRSNSRGRSRSPLRSNSRGRSRSQPRRNNRGGSRSPPGSRDRNSRSKSRGRSGTRPKSALEAFGNWYNALGDVAKEINAGSRSVSSSSSGDDDADCSSSDESSKPVVPTTVKAEGMSIPVQDDLTINSYALSLAEKERATRGESRDDSTYSDEYGDEEY